MNYIRKLIILFIILFTLQKDWFYQSKIYDHFTTNIILHIDIDVTKNLYKL